jgi:hypothetical protein
VRAGSSPYVGAGFQPDRGIQHFDMHARRLAREDAPARIRGVGPRRIDDRAGLLLDDRFGLALEPLQVGRLDEPFSLQARGIGMNRIPRRPVLVERAVDVPGVPAVPAVFSRADLRILPGRMRVAPEVQHVVVMGMAAHAE